MADATTVSYADRCRAEKHLDRLVQQANLEADEYLDDDWVEQYRLRKEYEEDSPHY